MPSHKQCFDTNLSSDLFSIIKNVSYAKFVILYVNKRLFICYLINAFLFHQLKYFLSDEKRMYLRVLKKIQLNFCSLTPMIDKAFEYSPSNTIFNKINKILQQT